MKERSKRMRCDPPITGRRDWHGLPDYCRQRAASEPVPFINRRIEPAKPWEVSQTHTRTAVKQRQDRRWKAKECLADSSNGGHPESDGDAS